MKKFNVKIYDTYQGKVVPFVPIAENKVSIYDALNKKNITQDALNSKVKTVITNAIKDANKIQLTGYETYSRDINSDIYNIENIETFFFGEDGSLYVLFPYGNNKFTSEMDIVKF